MRHAQQHLRRRRMRGHSRSRMPRLDRTMRLGCYCRLLPSVVWGSTGEEWCWCSSACGLHLLGCTRQLLHCLHRPRSTRQHWWVVHRRLQALEWCVWCVGVMLRMTRLLLHIVSHLYLVAGKPRPHRPGGFGTQVAARLDGGGVV